MLCSGFEPGASHKIVGEEGYLSMSLVKKLSLCHLFLFVLFSIYISLSRSQKLWINKSPQAHITHINTHFLFLSFLLNFFLLPFHLLGIRYFIPLLVSVSLSRSIPTFTNFYSLHILSLSRLISNVKPRDLFMRRERDSNPRLFTFHLSADLHEWSFI